MKVDSLICACGNTAITTIVHIPACAKCHIRYAKEGRRHLAINERVFFKSVIDNARASGIKAATERTFEGY